MFAALQRTGAVLTLVPGFLYGRNLPTGVATMGGGLMRC